MIKVELPRPGYSLVDLSRLCIEHGIYLHIGCADRDVAADPPVITIQMTTKMHADPEAFSFRIPVGEPELNLKLSSLVRDYFERMSTKPRLVIAP
jgi:hypothetical protein